MLAYLLLSLALPWSCQLYKQQKMDDFQDFHKEEAIALIPPRDRGLLSPGPSPKFVRFTRNINEMILAKSRLRFQNILDKIRLSHVG
jgi:hypothetical protein